MSVIDDLATYGLSVVKLLGEGAFGKVYLSNPLTVTHLNATLGLPLHH
jgi:hypothetical protein